MRNPYSDGIIFRKTGREIKSAIQSRCKQLRSRLDRRNSVLDQFLGDRGRVRSYLVRSSKKVFDMHEGTGYILGGKDDISVEQMEEINQLCQRILELEQELRRLELVATHLNDEETFELQYQELVGYGFDLQ
jgi:hypothetical protein